MTLFRASLLLSYDDYHFCHARATAHIPTASLSPSSSLCHSEALTPFRKCRVCPTCPATLRTRLQMLEFSGTTHMPAMAPAPILVLRITIPTVTKGMPCAICDVGLPQSEGGAVKTEGQNRAAKVGMQATRCIACASFDGGRYPLSDVSGQLRSSHSGLRGSSHSS